MIQGSGLDVIQGSGLVAILGSGLVVIQGSGLVVILNNGLGLIEGNGNGPASFCLLPQFDASVYCVHTCLLSADSVFNNW